MTRLPVPERLRDPMSPLLISCLFIPTSWCTCLRYATSRLRSPRAVSPTCDVALPCLSCSVHWPIAIHPISRQPLCQNAPLSANKHFAQIDKRWHGTASTAGTDADSFNLISHSLHAPPPSPPKRCLITLRRAFFFLFCHSTVPEITMLLMNLQLTCFRGQGRF